jgi:alpha-tubulin suppressor-like RCC1 family protein
VVALLVLILPLALGVGNNQTTAEAAAPTKSATPKPTPVQKGSPTKAKPKTASTPTYAWGYNDRGQLGNGTFSFVNPVPSQVTLPAGVNNFTKLSTGGVASLGMGDDGKLYSWGDNSYGQLGNGSSDMYSNVPVPVSLPAGVSSFKDFAAASTGGLALTSDGKLYAWGDNGDGEFGNGTISATPGNLPVMVNFPTGVTSYTAFSAGATSHLAMGNDGKLYSWGDNTAGQLGNSTVPTMGVNAYSDVPVTVDLPAGVANFTTFAVGNDFNLAIGNDGKLYGWGDNSKGQLGTTVTSSDLPVPVSLPAGVSSFTSFALGARHSLGMGNDGKLYAWGMNDKGELGNNSNSDSPVPVPVSLPAGVSSFTSFAAGSGVSLGLGNDGKLYAWGDNSNGDLGNSSTTIDSNVPLPVNLPHGTIKNFATGHASTHSFATIIPSTDYFYYLPLVANNATTAVGQTTTFVTFQNLSSSATASVSIQYYGLTSGTPGTTDSLTLPISGQKAILPNIGANSSGGGIIDSTQPLNVVVSEAIATGGSAYTVTGQTASTLYSPLALAGAFGGFTTSITIFNAGIGTSSGQIQYYDANGTIAATQPFSISSNASQTLTVGSLGLSDSQAYWAKISATNASDTLTAQVIEFGPNNFVATFNASVATQAATTLFAPAAFNGLYGYVTGMAFANPNSTAANLTLTYYDASGNSVGSQALTIPANGNSSAYQGATGNSPNLTSAVIKSDQPIVMSVNERGANNVSGTYVGIGSGSTNVALPVMANGFAGFVTGATIFNAGTGTATLTLTYLDGTGATVGNAQSTATLAPNASFALYQGAANQGLSTSFFGTALITSNQPLIVTTNALQNGTGLFYTYTEPSK